MLAGETVVSGLPPEPVAEFCGEGGVRKRYIVNLHVNHIFTGRFCKLGAKMTKQRPKS